MGTIIRAARAAGLGWERTTVCTFRNNLNKIAQTAVFATVRGGGCQPQPAGLLPCHAVLRAAKERAHAMLRRTTAPACCE